jgi:hypothetical protein
MIDPGRACLTIHKPGSTFLIDEKGRLFFYTLTEATDNRSPDRIAKQNVVDDTPGNRYENSQAAASSHRNSDHEEYHQVLEDECRQRHLNGKEDDRQRERHGE